FGTDKKRVPSPYEIQNTLRSVGSRMVRLQGKTLLVARPVMFDLGSYGKGYALSIFASHAARLKIHHYLINFGGNIIARGRNPRGRYWTVGIQNPRTDGVYVTVSLSNETISTSGDYENCFFVGNDRYHHIMDAATGYPSRAAIAATIIGNDATAVDALSTIAVIEGTNFFARDFNYRSAWIFTETSNAVTVYTRTNLIRRRD
ncbi:MAG: FAD:protein FMN transferase, partial [Spirochaetota bacterium]